MPAIISPLVFAMITNRPMMLLLMGEKEEEMAAICWFVCSSAGCDSHPVNCHPKSPKRLPAGSNAFHAFPRAFSRRPPTKFPPSSAAMLSVVGSSPSFPSVFHGRRHWMQRKVREWSGRMKAAPRARKRPSLSWTASTSSLNRMNFPESEKAASLCDLKGMMGAMVYKVVGHG